MFPWTKKYFLIVEVSKLTERRAVNDVVEKKIALSHSSYNNPGNCLFVDIVLLIIVLLLDYFFLF